MALVNCLASGSRFWDRRLTVLAKLVSRWSTSDLCPYPLHLAYTCNLNWRHIYDLIWKVLCWFSRWASLSSSPGRYKMLSASLTGHQDTQQPKIKILFLSFPLACTWLSDYILAGESRQMVMCNFEKTVLHGRGMFSFNPAPTLKSKLEDKCWGLREVGFPVLV